MAQETINDSAEADAREFAVDKKAIFGWSMFDFANSSFTTVMITAYFSIYFVNQLVGKSKLDLFGWSLGGEALWGFCQGISQSLVIVTAPLLGALADFSGNKKGFLFITYVGCALFTFLLGFVHPGQVVMGMTLFIIANIAFSSGENFISAFLPEIAPPRLMGKISGVAWGVGYIGGIGSLLLSVAILALVKDGYPYVWMMIGAWFFIAGLPTFMYVPERHKKEVMPPGQTMWTVGFHRLKETWIHRRTFHQLSRFLWIFAIFTSGVNAVVVFAALIAKDVMHFNETQLGLFLIVINVSAVIGAFGSGPLADKFGSRQGILGALAMWLLALIFASLIRVQPDTAPSTLTTVLFWIVGNMVGAAMGATYSASRALVGKFSPIARAGEFFGLWGMFGKLGAVIGPVSFGLMVNEFGLRVSILALGVFFIVGFAAMFMIDEVDGLRAAADWDRAQAAPPAPEAA